MKYIALLLATASLWFGFTALSIFADKSNHMGSVVRNAEHDGQWERKLAKTSLDIETQKYWLAELRNLKSEGEKGYHLLQEATLKLGIASILLGFMSLYVFGRTKVRK